MLIGMYGKIACYVQGVARGGERWREEGRDGERGKEMGKEMGRGGERGEREGEKMAENQHKFANCKSRLIACLRLTAHLEEDDEKRFLHGTVLVQCKYIYAMHHACPYWYQWTLLKRILFINFHILHLSHLLSYLFLPALNRNIDVVIEVAMKEEEEEEEKEEEGKGEEEKKEKEEV